MIRLISLLTLFAVSIAEVVHPCAKDQTRECFANYLSKVAGCEAPNSLPEVDSFKVASAIIEMPYFRQTIKRYEATVEGISKVDNFVLFYDTDSKVTVLSFTFPFVTVCGRQEIQYHDPRTIDLTLDTAFRNDYANVTVTAQWDGVESIKIGSAKLYSYVESIGFDLKDYTELAAAIEADPKSVPALDFELLVGNSDIFVREEESQAGRQIVRPFWNNWLCTNLP